MLFASHVGTCWIDLGRPKEARPLMQSVWDSGKDQARRRVYAASQLARVALLDGDIEEATTLGTTAVESASGLTSHRSQEQLKQLRQKFVPHARHASVKEFEQRADFLLAG